MSNNDKTANEQDIYAGRGTENYYDDYMDFINYVFGFNGNRDDFKKLLPKIYRPEDKPVENSYIVAENVKLKAAIGAYDILYNAFGEDVKIRGIGNVAVHPYARSKGYMKLLMNRAVEDMIADGVDMSELGGRRQRYNYFSYDKLGRVYDLKFVNDNFRHTFGKERTSKFRIVKVSPEDKEILVDIAKLISAQPYHPVRNEAKLYDILVSWLNDVYAVLDGDGKFAGYCIYKSGRISEMLLKNPADTVDFLISFYDGLKLSDVSVSLPEYMPEYIRPLIRLCEGYSIGLAKSFSIFNYRKIIRIFMMLKNTYEPLPDGTFRMLIHGVAGDERLELSVKNGEISVEPTDKDVDIELGHLDAMNFIFGSVAPERNEYPAFVRCWLPLPIWLFAADGV